MAIQRNLLAKAMLYVTAGVIASASAAAVIVGSIVHFGRPAAICWILIIVLGFITAGVYTQLVLDKAHKDRFG